jgi:hypothetical protein
VRGFAATARAGLARTAGAATGARPVSDFGVAGTGSEAGSWAVTCAAGAGPSAKVVASAAIDGAVKLAIANSALEASSMRLRDRSIERLIEMISGTIPKQPQ